MLNDDAAKPRFIETVVGKGYRFIAEVEEIEAVPAAPAIPDELKTGREQPVAVPGPVAIERTPGNRTRAAWGKWVTICLLAVAGFGAAWYWKDRSAASNELVFRQVTTVVPENRATAAAISTEGKLTAYARLNYARPAISLWTGWPGSPMTRR